MKHVHPSRSFGSSRLAPNLTSVALVPHRRPTRDGTATVKLEVPSLKAAFHGSQDTDLPEGPGGPFLVKPDLDKIPPPPPFFQILYRRSSAKNPGKIEAGPRPLSTKTARRKRATHISVGLSGEARSFLLCRLVLTPCPQPDLRGVGPS